ncbi:hypothetical protein QBC47DRAFT_357697 [Echria macrotheca]|uniref:Uncharacterized protein n=1 Tax=Echria macrotheca TaxID=438768 RepID=A0AAJ0BMN9_9PEZI|nr:hypothetical protein QBC47DRAFT_357697 [Echria macrotheca]
MAALDCTSSGFITEFCISAALTMAPPAIQIRWRPGDISTVLPTQTDDDLASLPTPSSPSPGTVYTEDNSASLPTTPSSPSSGTVYLPASTASLTDTPKDSATATADSGTQLSAEAIGGIATSLLFAVPIVAGLFVWLVKRRRRRLARTTVDTEKDSEKEAAQVAKSTGRTEAAELHGDHLLGPFESEGSFVPCELPAHFFSVDED